MIYFILDTFIFVWIFIVINTVSTCNVSIYYIFIIWIHTRRYVRSKIYYVLICIVSFVISYKKVYSIYWASRRAMRWKIKKGLCKNFFVFCTYVCNVLHVVFWKTRLLNTDWFLRLRSELTRGATVSHVTKKRSFERELQVYRIYYRHYAPPSSDLHSELYPGDHILCFNLSIVPGITEFRKKNNAYSEHTKLSAIKHSCRVTQPMRNCAGVHDLHFYVGGKVRVQIFSKTSDKNVDREKIR